MSADAFAVSLGKGSTLKNPDFKQAAKIGAVFGATEGTMPLLGWLAGSLAASVINKFDHWIAFFILGGIGVKMMYECFYSPPNAPNEQNPSPNWLHPTTIEIPDETDRAKKTPKLLFLSAIATSLDSMAVGVSLAFLDTNILVTAAMIGLATFTMSTLAIMAGHILGKKTGKIAEGLGGLCLLLIGLKILLEHLQIIA